MVLEILRGGVTHVVPSFLSGRSWLPHTLEISGEAAAAAPVARMPALFRFCASREGAVNAGNGNRERKSINRNGP
jgi:hypothetical protein